MNANESINTIEGRLFIFSRFMKIINIASDFEEAIALIAGETKILMQSEAMIVFLFDQDTKTFYYNTSFGTIADVFRDAIIEKNNAFSQRAQNAITPLYSNNPKSDKFFLPALDYLKNKDVNMLFAPLRSRKKVIGALLFINKLNGSYNEDDVSLVRLLTDFVSLSITNQQLYQKSQSGAYEASALYQMSMAVNEYDTAEEILQENMSIVCEAFEVHRVSIILIEDGKFVFKSAVGISNNVIKDGVEIENASVLSEVLRTGRGIYCVNVNSDTRFKPGKSLRYKSKSFMVSPIFAKDEIIGFISVTERATRIPFRLADLSLLEMLAQQIGENYKNILLNEEAQLKQKIDVELAITAHIQKSILPENFTDSGGIEISVQNIPAKEVGGDFYDFIKLGPHKYACIIADVSGKGVPAGLFMTMTRSMLKVHFGITADPAKVFTMTNKYIYADSKTGMFVTCFAGIIDTKKREIKYSNAGHGEQYLVRKSGSSSKIEFMRAPSKPLGVIENAKFSNQKIKYESGDIIFLFTDGVTDTFNESGKDYSDERLQKLIKSKNHLSSDEIKKTVLESIMTYKGKAEQFDDITFMSLKLP